MNLTPYTRGIRMLRTKSISISFSAILSPLIPEIAMAAEKSSSSFLPPIWPLLLFIAIVVIFRKQLNCVKPLDLEQPPSPADTKLVDSKTTIDDTAINTETTNNSINLNDNSGQCQASTAKGMRCKRTLTLQEVSVTIEDQTYILTVCKQHNTDSLKPFSGLLNNK